MKSAYSRDTVSLPMSSSAAENSEPAVHKRQLARLNKRYQEIAAQLAKGGFILKGSVVERFLTCGNPGCQCRADPPRLHGPYWQWSTRVEGKTVTRRISREQARCYREWIDNRRRAEQVLEEMHEISSQAAAILFGHLPPRASPVHRPRYTRST